MVFALYAHAIGCACLTVPASSSAEIAPFAPDFEVNEDRGGSLHGASVAMDCAGRFVVAWSDWQSPVSSYFIRARRFDSEGVPLRSELVLNTHTSTRQISPAVATTPSNGFIITWTGHLNDGNGWGIAARLFDENGEATSPEFVVNTHTTEDQASSSIAVANDGRFLVVWQSYDIDQPERTQDGADSGVFGQLFDAAGARLGTELQVNTYTTYDQALPSVAATTAGDFVVIWSSGYVDYYGLEQLGPDGDQFGAFARRFDRDASPLGTEFQVNSYTSENQIASGIAATTGGGFVVVWDGGVQYESDGRGQDGDLFGVFGQRFDAHGAPLGTEFRVNSYTTGYQVGATVAPSRMGGFVAVWTSIDGGIFEPKPSQDGDGGGIFGQQLDSIGTPVGSEFQLNTYTTGGQGGAALASGPGGSVVAVWSSAPLPSLDPIVARRFYVSIPGCDDLFPDRPSVFDAFMALRAALGSIDPDRCPLERCDTNCDGRRTASDALAILRRVTCMIPEGCSSGCCWLS